MAKSNDIFDRLKQDHDLHRELLAKIDATHGDSDERQKLFAEFTFEAKGHAAAEEQALYSTVMRKPPLTEDARHSVAEHHDIEELLNDTASVDMTSGAWLAHFRALKDKYLHHIKEEEDEHFPEFAEALDDADLEYMRGVFEKRKRAEKAAAEITPEPLDEAKE